MRGGRKRTVQGWTGRHGVRWADEQVGPALADAFFQKSGTYMGWERQVGGKVW